MTKSASLWAGALLGEVSSFSFARQLRPQKDHVCSLGRVENGKEKEHADWHVLSLKI
ncbi:hypothetical protein [Paenibacillus sp. SN-8-1]|uniref:hypothetical protein n=1 Tax=Paenibacillus sp. SN-8-1 TaxID=3435409 RepID=UPI003D9A833B